MKIYYRLCIASLILAFSVILAGGIVRTTGSGMGCPDWPKCFGQYIPPTDISQLPPNYKAVFQVKGKEIADFDAFKTWVEYINRLLGAILGIMIVIQTLLALRLRSYDFWLPILSIALLIVTGFVGWLGSVVVATDLEPFKITVHMMTSIVIITLATTLVHKAKAIRLKDQTPDHSTDRPLALPSFFFIVLATAICCTLAQIIMGTQVREQIDTFSKALEGRWREKWIEQLSFVFIAHRSFSWIIMGLNGYIIWRILKLVGVSEYANSLALRRLMMALASLILLEIFLGIIMTYFAIPKIAQPLHLLCAISIFAVQWRFGLMVWNIGIATKQHPN